MYRCAPLHVPCLVQGQRTPVSPGTTSSTGPVKPGQPLVPLATQSLPLAGTGVLGNLLGRQEAALQGRPCAPR